MLYSEKTSNVRDLPTTDKNIFTHNFHPYPAKFPPYAVDHLIENYSKEKDVILDPFCGSGTTLVECRLLGRNSIGIELNPVGVLISRAKSYPYEQDDLNELKNIIEELEGEGLNFIEWCSRYSTEELNIDSPNIEKWFSPKSLVELNAIMNFINERSYSREGVNLLLKTAFSRIVVPISNQESETRYAAIPKTITEKDAFNLFVRTLKSYYSSIANNFKLIRRDVNVNVIEGDSTSLLKEIPSSSVNFVVTSPPYMNSFDYYLYHKQRIYWLGGDPKEVRRKEIGGHHTVDRMTFDDAFSRYRRQLEVVFSELNRVLKSRGYFAILIGDGIVKGKKADVSALIKQLAENTNFNVLEVTSVPLRTVSRGFIKGQHIDRKKHHIAILQKSS